MFFSGEICPAMRRVAESAEYQSDHWFTKSTRVAVLPCDASEPGSVQPGFGDSINRYHGLDDGNPDLQF